MTYYDIMLVEGDDYMMRISSLVSVIILVIVLCACGINANPIENPNIDDFVELYVGDDYIVLVRTEIEPDAIYHRAAFSFGYGDNSCTVGGYEESNYMFLYKGNYYDIVQFNKFRVSTCDDLTEIGIKGEFD